MFISWVPSTLLFDIEPLSGLSLLIKPDEPGDLPAFDPRTEITSMLHTPSFLCAFLGLNSRSLWLLGKLLMSESSPQSEKHF